MGDRIPPELQSVVGAYERKLCKLLKRNDVKITRPDCEGYLQSADGCYGLFSVTIAAKCLGLLVTQIHSFTLTPMPHCCGVLISSGARTSAAWAAKGIGALMNEFRTKVATELGYSLMICTDRTGNAPQEKILTKNNWQEIHQFHNRRSGNDVKIHVVET